MHPEKKLQALTHILKEMKGVVVAFSGGADSTLLLKVAADALGKRVLAVTAVSHTYPEEELKEAKRIACLLKVKHRLIRTREWDNLSFRKNPKNRCYYCKKELFRTLSAIAGKEDLEYVVDGTTRSDLADFRPGSRAAKELGVRHPLLEAGLAKDDIRLLSYRFCLPTAGKPAAACLASRIPYGTPLSKKVLKKIEEGERYLRSLGLSGHIRLRAHGDICRIEVNFPFFNKILAEHLKITTHLRKIGFKFVTLDLEGYRTGSLNPET